MFLVHLSRLSFFNRNDIYGIFVLKTKYIERSHDKSWSKTKCKILHSHANSAENEAPPIKTSSKKKGHSTFFVCRCNHYHKCHSHFFSENPFWSAFKILFTGWYRDKLAIAILQHCQRRDWIILIYIQKKMCLWSSVDCIEGASWDNCDKEENENLTMILHRADSSLVDKPGNTPVHGGLTGFGKVHEIHAFVYITLDV